MDAYCGAARRVCVRHGHGVRAGVGCGFVLRSEVHLSSSCAGQIVSGAILVASVDHGVYPRLYGCSLLQDTFSGRLNDVRLRRKAKQAGRDARHHA